MKWFAIDFDGTVANCDWRLKHILDMETRKKLPGKKRRYDLFYKDAHLDPPIHGIINTIKKFAEDTDTKLFTFLTGRPARMRNDSIAWVKEHMPWVGLFNIVMRDEGDFRPDHVVKPELMKLMIDHHMDTPPLMVWEDRDGVVEAYKKFLDPFTIYHVQPDYSWINQSF